MTGTRRSVRLAGAALVAVLTGVASVADAAIRLDGQDAACPMPAATLAQADRLLTQGRIGAAITLYRSCRADNDVSANADRVPTGAIRAQIGLAHADLMAGALPAAERAFDTALRAARRSDDPLLAALALNGRALAATAAGDDQAALDHFRTADAALDAAPRDGAGRLVRLDIAVNASRAWLRIGDVGQAVSSLQDAARHLATVRQGTAPATLALREIALAATAAAIRDAAPADPSPVASVERSFRWLDAARGSAQASGDPGLAASALGHLAQLYRMEGRPAEARTLATDAIAETHRAGLPFETFRWEWLAGELAATLGQPEAALIHYRRARAALAQVQRPLVYRVDGFGRGYGEQLGPFFRQFSEALLAAAAPRDAPGGLAQAPVSDQPDQTALREALSVIEGLRTIQVQDYFIDDCVAALASATRAADAAMDQPQDRAAVLYPVILDDRLVTIVLIDGRLQAVSAEIDAAQFTETVKTFRTLLERAATRQYLRPARTLYQTLIAPLAPLLQSAEIDTLVIVPDRALRAIPYAALHDGERFVAERFATVVAPSLSLLAGGADTPVALDPAAARERVVIGGLTTSVQGFAPLPNVEREAAAIADLFEADILLDQSFGREALRQRIREAPPNVLHLASHGVFERRAADSFILTYDDRLSLDDLELLVQLGAFRDRPVDLLVLSACRTAAGDELAALGLAGIGLKAGARASVASLWFMSDDASATLVSAFYSALAGDGAARPTKAEALRQAQLAMLADPRYAHPAYWSGFLLAGAWR